MTGVTAEVSSLVALLAVIVVAVARPKGWSEAWFAVPLAVALLVTGAVSTSSAWSETRRLLPVVGFLALILAMAQLCDREGLFAAVGGHVARVSGDRPHRLLLGVFVTASVTTAVLSLDATVVLLTPVVFATAARLGTRPSPHVHACSHLANTASLLLPVSNLTNLLAFAVCGLSFARFTGLMALPWLVAIAVEYVVLRRFFRADLAAGARPAAQPHDVPLPRYALVVLAATLVGFAVASSLSLDPAWAALLGVLALAVRALGCRRTTVREVVVSANPGFLAFVLALGVIVKGVLDHGLSQVLARVVPGGTSWPALLAVAGIAALLANLVNNLPAVLALLPIVTPIGAGAVLAVLVGVNVGPNLTYVGSLATLLWRRVVHRHEHEVSLAGFTRLGLLTVPAGLVAATTALWAMLQVTGG